MSGYPTYKGQDITATVNSDNSVTWVLTGETSPIFYTDKYGNSSNANGIQIEITNLKPQNFGGGIIVLDLSINGVTCTAIENSLSYQSSTQYDYSNVFFGTPNYAVNPQLSTGTLNVVNSLQWSYKSKDNNGNEQQTSVIYNNSTPATYSFTNYYCNNGLAFAGTAAGNINSSGKDKNVPTNLIDSLYAFSLNTFIWSEV